MIIIFHNLQNSSIRVFQKFDTLILNGMHVRMCQRTTTGVSLLQLKWQERKQQHFFFKINCAIKTRKNVYSQTLNTLLHKEKMVIWKSKCLKYFDKQHKSYTIQKEHACNALNKSISVQIHFSTSIFFFLSAYHFFAKFFCSNCPAYTFLLLF